MYFFRNIPKNILSTNISPTLVDCQWGTWGSWGWCYGSCPNQSMKRKRSKIVIACGGGQDCQGSSSEVAPCQPNQCEFLFSLKMLFRIN